MNPCRVITIFNQKGGVGKTTAAVTLAHGLAREKRNTCLIDLDGQGNVAVCLGLEKAPNLFPFLFQSAGKDALIGTGRRGLAAILTDRSTTTVDRMLAGETLREFALKRALEGIKGFFDYIVIDCPPSAGILQINAICAADYFLIPVLCDYLSAPNEALGTASALIKIGATAAAFLGILPNQYSRTTSHTSEMYTWLQSTFKTLLWDPIPVDTKVREASRQGQTVWEYAPISRAAVGYWNDTTCEYIGGYKAALKRLLEATNGG